MKLNTEQIKSITLGAVNVKQNENGYEFLRFTDEQTEIYKNVQDSFYLKTFAPSGVRLSFTTDSRTLGIEVLTSVSSTRKYYSFDIFMNGFPVAYLDNFGGKPLPIPYCQAEFPLGKASKTVNLGEGEKHIVIHFPWSICVTLCSLELDDGARLPVSLRVLSRGRTYSRCSPAFCGKCACRSRRLPKKLGRRRTLYFFHRRHVHFEQRARQSNLQRACRAAQGS